MANKDELTLQKIAVLISDEIDKKIGDAIKSEKEIDDLIKETSFYKALGPTLNEFECDKVFKMIKASRAISFGSLTLISENIRKDWFTKAKFKDTYYSRYRAYLQKSKGFSDYSLKNLSEKKLNPIVNQLGDPREESFNIHGLVMGDVQSGKTLTYLGLANKAVDAGYKFIIILTGTVEALRKQTQKRVDEGFTGIDSNCQTDKYGTNNLVGVGKIEGFPIGPRAVSLTNKKHDFVESNLEAFSVTRLDSFRDPVIIVAKKNVSILAKIHEWIIKQHNFDFEEVVVEENTGKTNKYAPKNKMDKSLLLIDDEADYASINTVNKPESDPTRTNGWIRRILNLFKKYSYLGFSATPFANIFIQHDKNEKRYGPDLFPNDFIINLETPTGYIGADELFCTEGKYRENVIDIDDCEEIKSPKSKKYNPLKSLPESLKEAIYYFFITNVLRDINPEDNPNSDRGMLINITKNITEHEKVKDLVEPFINEVCNSYDCNCKNPFAKDDVHIKNTKAVFDKYFSASDYDWDTIKSNLPTSNKNPVGTDAKRIQIKIVNSNSQMIDYEEYKGNGARLILIGGFSLSRGLTIEGLCVSYFVRNSKNYDTLFQMGRWFGYRPHYDHLIKIYMPEFIKAWYTKITDSVEELKGQLNRMVEINKKPSEFGLRIKNDIATLRITARNKMLYAKSAVKTVLGFGDIIATPDIINNVKVNENNINAVCNVLKTDIENNGLKWEVDELSNNPILKGVSLKAINDIIDNTEFSIANDYYNKESMKEFLNRESIKHHFKEWDVVIVQGDRHAEKYNVPILDLDIYRSIKAFDSPNDSYIRIQRAFEQLNNPRDTRAGLTKNQYYKVKVECFNIYQKLHSSEPDKIKGWVETRIAGSNYLKLDYVDYRRPILLIYFIKLKEAKPDDLNKDSIDKIIKKFGDVPPLGLAFGIPDYEKDNITDQTLYMINTVEQNRINRETNDVFSDYEDEEEEE